MMKNIKESEVWKLGLIKRQPQNSTITQCHSGVNGICITPHCLFIR